MDQAQTGRRKDAKKFMYLHQMLSGIDPLTWKILVVHICAVYIHIYKHMWSYVFICDHGSGDNPSENHMK